LPTVTAVTNFASITLLKRQTFRSVIRLINKCCTVPL